MKKLILFILISYFLSLISYQTVFAADATPAITNQINDLKDRIASRVAQLKLVERRGILGKVTSVADTQITLVDLDGNIRFVDVDELTKFQNSSVKGSFGISDIKKDDILGILGIYNKQSRRILGRFVIETSVDTIIHGDVSSVDSKNFTFIVIDKNGISSTINVNTPTKLFLYTKTGGFLKAGFSKIKVGQRIITTGSIDSKDSSLFDADRVIILSEITKEIISPTLTPIPTPTPIQSGPTLAPGLTK